MSDALFDHALVVKNLVEAAEGMVIKLSTGITVIVKRFTLAFGRFEPIPVVVVHRLRISFLDEFIQFLLDEPGETQVMLLDPLFLVVTDRDGLARCYIILYIIYGVKLLNWVNQWGQK